VLRVGLTGGIACGKSHVLRRLAARGCRTLDLDSVARAVTAPGCEALAEIRAAFGASVIDAAGGLDRAALGALVFRDATARERLNRIVHPRVRAAEASWAAGFARAGSQAVVVTDAALLVESGAHLRFDRLLVVHCAPEVQLARLRARDGLDEAAARARIAAQLPLAEKRAFAHLEVDTSGDLASTERAADAAFDALSRLASRPEAETQRPPLERLLGGLVHGPHVGPRGLTPDDVVLLAARHGGLELEALAARLTPAADGPWYRAAAVAPPGAEATALVPALVASALAARPRDPDWLVAAAASLARLTHASAASRADACQLTLLLQDVAVRGAVPADLEARANGHAALATRWGGGAPSGRLAPVVRAALQGRDDPQAARAALAGSREAAELAAALVGIATGAPAGAASQLDEALRRIAAPERAARPA
jgi:dephospho-CoA kinase